MTPLPEDDAEARAWRARIRLDYELEQVGRGPRVPSLRAQLMGSAGHWAIIMAGAKWGRR